MASFNIALIGPPQVGKTAYMHKLLTGYFLQLYWPTKDVDVRKITFDTSHGPVKFSVWDRVVESHYGSMNAAIVMFDVTRDYTYKDISYMMRGLPSIPVVICGNKIDLPYRTIETKDVQRGTSCYYYDMSVKTGYNLCEPFLVLARRLMNIPDLTF